MTITISATVTQLVTALAALAAAIVGPWVAYLVAKRSIVSGRRVEWNLELRTTIVEFVTAVWQASSTRAGGAIPESRLGELLERMGSSKAKIELLVNPDEVLHQEFVDSTGALLTVALEYRKARDEDEVTRRQILDRTDIAMENVLALGRKVLKTEWEKAKSFQ